MFCENCGKIIPDGAMFCPDCGNRLKEKTKKKKETFEMDFALNGRYYSGCCCKNRIKRLEL